jgi:serine/threonine protein kinase
MALDWSGTGHTTTSRESFRTPKYAAPETSDGLERNSSADIWSLGCVFLEMIAVLKGMSRAEVNDILKKNGSGSENYRQNPKGIVVVVERPKEMEAECGDVPPEWVEQMLKLDKDDRPNARQLRTMIFESKCELPMWGFCCSGVSIFGESSSTSSASQPDQPMVPVVWIP